MLIYIARRFLHIIPVIIGVTIVLFLLMSLVSSDPARMLAGKSATPQMIKNIEERLGLNKPLYVQYGMYMWKLAHGDFGYSWRYRRPVADILKDHYPNSVRLALVAIVIETLIGVVAGIISAVRKNSFLDTVSTLATTIVVCMPLFWFAMLLQYFFGVELGLLPVAGMAGWDSYILPAVALAAVSTAYVARMTRSGLIEVMGQDYILTAYAKGLSEAQVIRRHALKNALIPVITLIGLDLGVMIGAAILTETVFSWPGIGRQIYLGILQRDPPVVLGGTLILVIVYLTINLVVDIMYAYLDPKIRYEQKEAV